jgi:dipeptidyl-peptidase-3
VPRSALFFLKNVCYVLAQDAPDLVLGLAYDVDLIFAARIEKRVRDGKTYFVVNDYEALRGLFAELLAEIQRIKSEGDFEAARLLVERYAVQVDAELHQEVLERYRRLDLAPYKGFINPMMLPVYDQNGQMVDVQLYYGESYAHQMLRYSTEYGTLI